MLKNLKQLHGVHKDGPEVIRLLRKMFIVHRMIADPRPAVVLHSGNRETRDGRGIQL